MSIVAIPFEKNGVDLVGFLAASSGRHHYILVVINYATRYPEAMPLRTAMAEAVVQGLAVLFTRVGFPSRFLRIKELSLWAKC